MLQIVWNVCKIVCACVFLVKYQAKMFIGKKCWPFIIRKEIKVHRHASYNWIDQLPNFDQKKTRPKPSHIRTNLQDFIENYYKHLFLRWNVWDLKARPAFSFRFSFFLSSCILRCFVKQNVFRWKEHNVSVSLEFHFQKDKNAERVIKDMHHVEYIALDRPMHFYSFDLLLHFSGCLFELKHCLY